MLKKLFKSQSLIEINNDESVFILNGVEYETKYAESCKGCAFVNPKNNECFFASAYITKCMRMYRKDSQSIQWIQKGGIPTRKILLNCFILLMGMGLSMGLKYCFAFF